MLLIVMSLELTGDTPQSFVPKIVSLNHTIQLFNRAFDKTLLEDNLAYTVLIA